jgi:hypothetical protein
VYSPKGTGPLFYRALLFLGGNDLLVVVGRSDWPNFHLYRVNVTRPATKQLI